MKKARWVSAAAGAAVLAAGFALPASAAVTGGGGNGNSGVLSVLSGNNVNAPVSLPVNVCGVAVTLLGGANAGCAGGASSTTVLNNGSGGGGNGNAGVASVGSGNTVNAPVSAPVNLCGVSGAVGGFANSGCKGGSHATTIVGSGGSGGGNGNAGVASVLSGNTVNAPVSAPVNVCSVSLALLGFANSGCFGGSSSTTVIGSGTSGGGNGNAGQASLLSGNNVNAPVSAPVNVCSVSLALLGFANSGCTGGSHSVVVIPPPCQHECNTPPPCQHDCNTPPPCQHECNTPPPCQHDCNTPPPCQHECNTPPPCQHECNTPPPGTQTTPPGTPPSGHMPPPGSGSGSGPTSTTVPGTLPITGANLLGMLVAALVSVGVGATLVIARRRRHGEGA